MDAQTLLGPDGLIARRWPDFESRPEQLRMAQAVQAALGGPHHLMVEAGTGVGKSFAYLVPALLAARADKDRKIVISTHTIHLQEQLLQKDIPFLQKLLPEPVPVALAKGRSNYLSLRRLRVTQQRMGALFADRTAIDQLQRIGPWSRQTADGSRSDLPLQPLPAVWDAVESDSGNCLGKRCKTHSSCFYYKARRGIFGAQILIVNHALFFSDLALRRQGASLLPDYHAVIFDEAHTLEDVAADHLGLRVTQGAIDYLFGKLFTDRTGKGLLALLGDQEDLTLLDQVRATSDRFFYEIQRWHESQGKASGRVRAPGLVADTLGPALRELAARLTLRAEAVGEEEEQVELRSIINRLLAHAEGVEEWLAQSRGGQVYWVEFAGARIPRVHLLSAPIEVGPELKRQLYDKVPSVVLTSATLSCGGKQGFEHVQARVGLGDCTTLALGSPFNYRQQVDLRLYRELPDPSKSPREFEDAVIERLPELLHASRGRAFVLFTSNSFLKKAAERLRDRLRRDRYLLLCQGEGIPSGQLVEQFKAGERAVLFGVDTFWQGVDVKGEALSNVIITKLPFASPDRPLVAARMEDLEAKGGNSFFDYSIPQAIIKLKQGFGRLIRTHTDRGSVAIMDPRVLSKGYGLSFLKALPECRKWIDGSEVK